MTTTHRPCPAWCTSDHKPGPTHGHLAELGSIAGVYPIKVELVQPEKNSVRDEPFVRATYGTANGNRLLEVNTALASDFGHLIAALTIDVMGDVSAALMRGFYLTEIAMTSGERLADDIARLDTLTPAALAYETGAAELAAVHGETDDDRAYRAALEKRAR